LCSQNLAQVTFCNQTELFLLVSFQVSNRRDLTLGAANTENTEKITRDIASLAEHELGERERSRGEWIFDLRYVNSQARPFNE
jgi:hypothetical protein